MGNRLAKPPPLDRPVAPVRGRNAQMPRPFPAITPASYLPGAAGNPYAGFPPTGMPNNFPALNQNSYLPRQGLEPPIMNYSGGSGLLPPPMPYPNQGNMSMMAPQAPMYDPGFRRPHRRPTRVCRRSRRSRRCRPVIRIVESSSCSSGSSYTTLSSCSSRRRRSHSRRRGYHSQQQQQQQPIILLPIQYQQPPTTAAAPVPVQNQMTSQPQQIILPPIHIQQPGQFDQQQLALPPMAITQAGGQLQQQPFNFSQLQYNSSNLLPNNSSSPLVITAAQPMIQPSASLPQLANIGYQQQIQGGNIQYLQAMPQSSSPLQYISAEPRSTIAPQHVLVNSTNTKKSAAVKPVVRSVSVRDIPQNDLKFGRRPFDWYSNDKKKNIINENIQVGQRKNTMIS